MPESTPRLRLACAPIEAAAGAFIFRLTDHKDGAAIAIATRDQPERALWETVAGVPFVAFGEGTQRFRFARGSFRITHALRNRHDATHIDSVTVDGEGITIRGRLDHDAGGFCMRLIPDADRGLALEANIEAKAEAPGSDAINRATLRFATAADAPVYGFGAQYSVIDLRGRKLPIWSQEQGHGRGLQPLSRWVDLFAPGSAGDWHTTYTAVPHFVTADGRGFSLDAYTYSEFDLRDSGRIEVTVFAPRMQAHIHAGATPAAVVTAHTARCGRMPELPAWIHTGAVVRAGGGSEAVRSRLHRLREAGVPVAALWIEDWCGKRQTITGSRLWWNWEADADLYPDWERLVAELRGDGVRTIAYFNPFLVDARRKHNHRRNLFAEALAAGYLVRNRRGRPYMIGQGGFRAALLDLSHPGAREWIREQMRTQIEAGVSGWMNDFAEALPPDCILHSGEDPLTFHNRYPEEWARVAREAVEAAGAEGDAVFFCRSGAMRSPAAATLFWLGDQTVTWDAHDGLASVVLGLLSSGLSGYALNHADIGGYFSLNLPGLRYLRSPELYRRWAELAAFTAVFRTHDTNQPAANHQYDSDPETLAHFAAMARLFAALAPYRSEVVRQAHQTGLPVVRHLVLHYPDDPEVFGLDRQFLFGPDVLVAPILHPGHDRVRLYLPRGSWTHAWSRRSFEGQGRWLEVAAPVGQPAVFFRSDAAVAECFVAYHHNPRGEVPAGG